MLIFSGILLDSNIGDTDRSGSSVETPRLQQIVFVLDNSRFHQPVFERIDDLVNGRIILSTVQKGIRFIRFQGRFQYLTYIIHFSAFNVHEEFSVLHLA
mgnify:CR=1 FL=1